MRLVLNDDRCPDCQNPVEDARECVLVVDSPATDVPARLSVYHRACQVPRGCWVIDQDVLRIAS